MLVDKRMFDELYFVIMEYRNNITIERGCYNGNLVLTVSEGMFIAFTSSKAKILSCLVIVLLQAAYYKRFFFIFQ